MHNRAGARLRALRRRHGFSRRDVGRRTGLSWRDLSAYESGRQAVPDAVLASLARLYGVAPGEVVPARSSSQLEVAGDVLAAGNASRRVPDDAGPEEVLAEYLDLVRELRHAAPDDDIPLRDADLAVLADALGGTPEAIESRLVELIRCTQAEAREIRRALLKRRVMVPAAGVVVGLGALSPAVADDGDERPRATATDPVVAVEELTDEVADELVDTVEDVVEEPAGEPVDQPTDEAVDQPTDETVDQPADETVGGDPDPATPAEPRPEPPAGESPERGDDWAEIIDPLVIER